MTFIFNSMARKYVVGVMGYKRAGKDTVADYLVNRHGFVKMSIASPLKDTCKILFNLSDEELYSDKKDHQLPQWFGLTPRQLLQFFGTEMMQYKLQDIMPQTGRDFWMRNIVNRIENERNDFIVIPDIRFIHEYETLVNKYGRENTLFVSVSRLDKETASEIERVDKIQRVERVGRVERIEDPHVSENEWLEIKPDVSLYNSSTVEDLYKDIDLKIIHKL